MFSIRCFVLEFFVDFLFIRLKRGLNLKCSAFFFCSIYVFIYDMMTFGLFFFSNLSVLIFLYFFQLFLFFVHCFYFVVFSNIFTEIQCIFFVKTYFDLLYFVYFSAFCCYIYEWKSKWRQKSNENQTISI